MGFSQIGYEQTHHYLAQKIYMNIVAKGFPKKWKFEEIKSLVVEKLKTLLSIYVFLFMNLEDVTDL